MTNPSYTDEQVLEHAAWQSVPTKAMIISLLAERQRLKEELKKSQSECGDLEQKLETLGCGMFALQAEVDEAKTRMLVFRKRLIGELTERHGRVIAGDITWAEARSMAEADVNTLEQIMQDARATPNETKEAKS